MYISLSPGFPPATAKLWTVFSCDLRSLRFLKLLAQWVQIKGLLAGSWDALWYFSESDLRNDFAQMSQEEGLSLACSLLWFLKADLSLKALPQVVHVNGFSPVQCELSCAALGMKDNQMFCGKSCMCDWTSSLNPTYSPIFTTFGICSVTIIHIAMLLFSKSMVSK